MIVGVKKMEKDRTVLHMKTFRFLIVIFGVVDIGKISEIEEISQYRLT